MALLSRETFFQKAEFRGDLPTTRVERLVRAPIPQSDVASKPASTPASLQLQIPREIQESGKTYSPSWGSWTIWKPKRRRMKPFLVKVWIEREDQVLSSFALS